MSARLSPAASLLRNSKLFALPPQIALPPAPPSSDTVASSNTATTVYPQFASIQTTHQSGSRGDWGFKRPLPAKVTRTTSNPIVRLVSGIDTAQHVADFESAADHTLTLRKFQELNVAIRHEAPPTDRQRAGDRTHPSVFRASHDNTSNLSESAPANTNSTGVWPEVNAEEILAALPEKLQKKQRQLEAERKAQEEGSGVDASTSGIKVFQSMTAGSRKQEQLRWRYAGPSLTSMSGLQFDEYLNKLGPEQMKLVKESMRQEIREEKLVKAREEGKMDQSAQAEQVTEREVMDYMRYLRQNPQKFGPVLARVLDLPEAVTSAPRSSVRAAGSTWEFGRNTLATAAWKSTGPPRTHPSAGLSYQLSMSLADNHPVHGPQQRPKAALARAIRTKSLTDGRTPKRTTDWGVAGFVGVDSGPTRTTNVVTAYDSRPAGQKTPVNPMPSYVHANGTLRLRFENSPQSLYRVVDNKILYEQDVQDEIDAEAINRGRFATPSAPRLSDPYQTRRPQTRAQPTADIDAAMATRVPRATPLR